MRYVGLKLFYIAQSLTLYFFALYLTSCNSGYDKAFYGAYENLDTNRIVSSGITFYENNNYAFFYSTCFDYRRDSGHYSLKNDIISFRSFDVAWPDTNHRPSKTLSDVKFLYQQGKILYIQQHKPGGRPAFTDTTLIGTKNL